MSMNTPPKETQVRLTHYSLYQALRIQGLFQSEVLAYWKGKPSQSTSKSTSFRAAQEMLSIPTSDFFYKDTAQFQFLLPYLHVCLQNESRPTEYLFFYDDEILKPL